MIKLFNTLSRKKEVFKPIKGGLVGLYTCGPTVYSFAHIGNLRTYIFEDILRRTLENGGYKVKHVMNITDIDDKIIRDAGKAKKSIFEFAKPYETAFFSDSRKLNIKKAWKYPKATKHVRIMIALIQKLIKKKIAYIANDGVYFDISKFKTYGKLSRINRLGLRHLGRISEDEYEKKDAQDFALWKFVKFGEPSWKAPFGEGRPGWHIECSAMSMKYFGEHFDIHAGGVDLVFPHHENEIAQSEGATGKKFVNYFLEGEHLLINGEKMSKSLGNIFTLQDIEKRGFNPLAFRYFVLGAHYRAKLNFTWKALESAQKALEKIYEFVRSLKSVKVQVKTSRNIEISKYRDSFESAISDNLNTPKASAVLWNFVHDFNKNKSGRNIEIIRLLYEFDEILGLGLKKIKNSPVPQKIRELAQKREELRRLKKWSEADKIREELKKKGYFVEDTEKGPKISPVSPLLG